CSFSPQHLVSGIEGSLLFASGAKVNGYPATGRRLKIYAGSVPLLARPGARSHFLRRWRGGQAVAQKPLAGDNQVVWQLRNTVEDSVNSIPCKKCHRCAWLAVLLLPANGPGQTPGVPHTILEGHRGWVSSVAFAPDGQTLASASADQTVKLWSVAKGKLLPSLQGHADIVSSVAFAPDGKALVTGSYDKTARLWDLCANRILFTFR